jgi:hypothetical protein
MCTGFELSFVHVLCGPRTARAMHKTQHQLWLLPSSKSFLFLFYLLFYASLDCKYVNRDVTAQSCL